MRRIDMFGDRFGRLIVESVSHSSNSGVYWTCVCDCGKRVSVLRGNLISGNVASCGCLHRDTHTKHGKSKTREYTNWTNMKRRCLSPSHVKFPDYGGRGITLCDEWKNFDSFINDMGPAPTNKHTIDRINNDLGYTKENCRWASPKEQANNKRNNKLITAFGKTQTQAQWSRETGVSQQNIYSRLKRGFPPESAVSPRLRGQPR